MKNFICPTEDFIKSKITELSADVSSGSLVDLSVKNVEGFEEDDSIIIELEGNEEAELSQISSISTPTGITVNSLKFDHKAGVKITKIAFDKRRFYGCDTIDGVYTLIEEKDIEVDNPVGTYFEYTGSTYGYFKATYYNSVTSTSTDINDAIALQADDISHYCSVYEVREEAGFLENPYVTDGRINNIRLQAESEVKGSIAVKYSLPLSTIPEVIKNITKLLSAGFLLKQEYGAEADGTNKDGQVKIDEARKMLKLIREGDLVLLDSSDSKLSNESTNLSGWPNRTTADTPSSEGGGAIKFRISKRF